MKATIENYGQVLVGAILVVLCLGFLNFALAASYLPSIRSVPVPWRSPSELLDFVPLDIKSNPGLVDPVDLIGQDTFGFNDFSYLKTQGTAIYYRDVDYNRVMVQSDFVNGDSLDYSNVDFHDYHSFIDKVRITAIINNQVLVKEGMVIIEED
ncbi:MAG: hypothetical protein PHI41_00635 [Erysipelotrichaceae bacterium]|nr:hypothetical protein [Erysipelotrichaceae bacterium]MDD3809121.1 hypothetical protein [Erysipelotrichaceae bacterium]